MPAAYVKAMKILVSIRHIILRQSFLRASIYGNIVVVRLEVRRSRTMLLKLYLPFLHEWSEAKNCV